MSAPKPAPPQRQSSDPEPTGWGGDEPAHESAWATLLPVIVVIAIVIALGVLIVLAHVTGFMPKGIHGGGH